MRCAKCDFELLDGMKFCPKCGSKAPQIKSKLVCQKCGQDLEEYTDILFCPACGARVNSDTRLQEIQARSNNPRIDINKKNKTEQACKFRKHGSVVGFTLIGITILMLVVVGIIIFVKYNSSEAKTARFIEIGEQYLSDKNYDEAINSFRAALEIMPDSVDAYKGLIQAYKKSDDFITMMEILEEASIVTKDEYFIEKYEKLDDDYRRGDIAIAQEVREATLADIADGVLRGSGEFRAVEGNPTTISETPIGIGTPGRGCDFIIHYDAVQGTCSVTLNGFVLTIEAGATEYINYDGEAPSRTSDLSEAESTRESSVLVETETLENVGYINLTMWCIATESDSTRHSYEAAIADLAVKYPNITLYWEAFENQSYKTKIKAAVRADEMPDIFFTWSCAFMSDFVNAGKVYCLDSAYLNYEDELPEAMMGNSTFNGRHYGVPMTLNVVGLFANKELLRQVGYDEIPGTYAEFITCCNALKANGIIPFGCAGKETWCVTEYLESIIEKSIGADTMNDIFLGRQSWNNADVAAAVDAFQLLINSGYFDPDGIYLNNDEVKANFMAGKYAFYMNGTWNCTDFAWNQSFSSKVIVGEFPVINADKASLGQFIGGPSDTLAVASSSEHPEIAAQYCFELGKLICHYGYIDGCGLPAWIPYGDTSSVNPITQSVAELCSNANGYVLFGDTAMNADDANTYLNYVDQIYGGGINGNQFISGLARDIR